MIIVGCSSSPWSSVGASQRPVALLRNLSYTTGISTHAVDTHWGTKMVPLDTIRDNIQSALDKEPVYMGEDGCYLLLFAPLREYVDDLLPMARDMGLFLVYDCMEKWAALPGTDSWYSEESELALWNQADFVTYSSGALVPARTVSPEVNTLCWLPNACDPSLWQGGAPINDVLYGRELTAGYIGSLGNWLDWNLAESVDDMTGMDVAFNFIGDGSVPHSQTLKGLGYKPPKLVRVYLEQFDFLFVPFEDNELTRCVSPIKVYEALYCGVPVIATGLPEVVDLPGVRVVPDAYGVMEAIEDIEAITEEAKAHSGDSEYTWRSRVRKLQGTLVSCDT